MESNYPLPLLAVLLCGLTVAARAEQGRWRPLGRAEGLPSENVLDLCASGEDRIWAATAGGLCRIESHGVWMAGPPAAPRRLAAAPEGGVFALYDDRILYIRDGETNSLALPVDPARAPTPELASEADGTLWLTTRETVYRLPFGGAWERVPDRTGLEGVAIPQPRLPAAPVRIHRAIVHRGEIWGATRGRGILRCRISARFRHFAIPTSPRVHALALAPDGTVWCGTENGVASVKDGRVETVTHIDGVPLDVVTACAVDRKGRVWVGSGSSNSFRGVYRLSDGLWEHLEEIDGDVHRITVDPTGVLWFAVLNGEEDQGGGAWYYAGEKFERAPAIGDLPSARIYDVVARDQSGVLWFATLRGLAAYRGAGRVTHYTPESAGLAGEKVWCLCAARDGSLWIGYQGEYGVSRLSSGGKTTHFDVEDGLCDGNVWSIAEGPPGVFWVATQHGLSRYDGRRWSCFRGEEDFGVASIWPLMPDPDGSLWIGTLGAGLVQLVPDDRDPPRTRFAASQFTGEAKAGVVVAWSGTDFWYDTPADELWYRWRLDGGAWSDASPQRRLLLDPGSGEHRLEVQAIDKFGNVEDPPAEVSVVLVGRRFGLSGTGWYVAAGAGLLGLGVLIGLRAKRRGS